MTTATGNPREPACSAARLVMITRSAQTAETIQLGRKTRNKHVFSKDFDLQVKVAYVTETCKSTKKQSS